jgi:sulfur carrier protein
MKTLINGKSVELVEGATLSDVVAQLKLDPRGIAIAVNEAVVSRSRYTEHALAEDDRIEVIHAVAGG